MCNMYIIYTLHHITMLYIIFITQFAFITPYIIYYYYIISFFPHISYTMYYIVLCCVIFLYEKIAIKITLSEFI